jgi:hypothetical protein
MCLMRSCALGAIALLVGLLVMGHSMLTDWTSPFNLLVIGVVLLWLATRWAKHWGEKVPGAPTDFGAPGRMPGG